MIAPIPNYAHIKLAQVKANFKTYPPLAKTAKPLKHIKRSKGLKGSIGHFLSDYPPAIAWLLAI